MGDNIKVEYAGVHSPRIFAKQLGVLARELHMPMSTFQGTNLTSYIPGVVRWKIRTVILESLTNPDIQGLDYSRRYVSWDEGVDMAMHEALSRLCNLHHHRLPHDSAFHEFGRRDGNGEAVVAPGNRNEMPIYGRYVEDLEIKDVQMGKLLDMEAAENEHAHAVVQVQGLQIEDLGQAVADRDQIIAERDKP